MRFVRQIIWIVVKRIVCTSLDGTEVDDMIGKWTGSDTASAAPRWKGPSTFGSWGKVELNLNTLVGDRFAVATKAGWGILEKGRFCNIGGIQSPIPIPGRGISTYGDRVRRQERLRENIRVSSLVATLIFQSLFILPNEPSMPSKKLSLLNRSAD